MKSENTQEIVDALDQLLDRERQALLQGNLEEISDLMTLKQELFDRINALDKVEDHELEIVQEKVISNQALLNSALEGIRAVASRMADLRRVRSGLETYDSRGQKQNYDTQPGSSVEKRA